MFAVPKVITDKIFIKGNFIYQKNVLSALLNISSKLINERKDKKIKKYAKFLGSKTPQIELLTLI